MKFPPSKNGGPIDAVWSGTDRDVHPTVSAVTQWRRCWCSVAGIEYWGWICSGWLVFSRHARNV